MKKKYWIGSVATGAILLSLGAYQLGHYQATLTPNDKVDYIDGSKKAQKSALTKSKTQEQINEEEGISAEQIVVKITDDGYVTSHGDHYHYYNGKVPFNSLISEELIMSDPNYVFSKQDVVNDVKDGYIIKVDGNYYLYLKEGSKRENVRTKAQIAEQKEKGTAPAAHKHAKNHSHASHVSHKSGNRYTTDDGYVFSPTDVIEDTGDGFIVPHGNHFHFIPKSDLSASELAQAQAYWNQKSRPSHHVQLPKVPQPGVTNLSQAGHVLIAQPHHKQPENKENPKTIKTLLEQLLAMPLANRHVEADGLVFDPTTIAKRTESGVMVPHGNHYHYIPYAQMNALEQEIARIIPITNPLGTGGELKSDESAHHHDHLHHHHDTEPHSDDESDHSVTPLSERAGKPNSKIVYSAQEVAEAKKAGQYATSDGYIFDAKDIIKDTGDGFITPHMGHEHWIPKKELSAKELKEAEAFLADKKPEPEQPSSHQETHLLSAEDLDKTADAKELSAQEIFEKVQPQKIVPVDLIKANMVHTVRYTNGYLIIPHLDHYHNVPLSWFDKNWSAPEGYTLSELFATIKYYMKHPSEAPKVEGWGNDAQDTQQQNGELVDNNYATDEEPEEELEEDEFEIQMKSEGERHGLTGEEYLAKLSIIGEKYWVAYDKISYNSKNKVSVISDKGTKVVNLITLEEVEPKE